MLISDIGSISDAFQPRTSGEEMAVLDAAEHWKSACVTVNHFLPAVLCCSSRKVLYYSAKRVVACLWRRFTVLGATANAA